MMVDIRASLNKTGDGGGAREKPPSPHSFVTSGENKKISSYTSSFPFSCLGRQKIPWAPCAKFHRHNTKPKNKNFKSPEPPIHKRSARGTMSSISSCLCLNSLKLIGWCCLTHRGLSAKRYLFPRTSPSVMIQLLTHLKPNLFKKVPAVPYASYDYRYVVWSMLDFYAQRYLFMKQYFSTRAPSSVVSVCAHRRLSRG